MKHGFQGIVDLLFKNYFKNKINATFFLNTRRNAQVYLYRELRLKKKKETYRNNGIKHLNYFSTENG